ncbi:hypothetical protein CRYUN_Cryun39dG0043500 [Craigia yunnanensis]
MGCGFCESVLSSCVGTLSVDWVAKPVGHQLDYLRRFRDNVEQLREKKDELAMAQARLQHEIQIAENQLQEIQDDVRGLLSKADDILKDVESMEQEIEKNKRCFSWCPNWWWRYRLSKNLAKEKLVISKLLEKMAKFGQPGRVGYPSTSTFPTIEFLSSKDFIVSKASKIAFNRIVEALKDDNVSMIGLWGMGGLGKTTLAREVGNEAKKLNLFDKVVVTTVSQKPNFHKIQDEIAKFLDFGMNSEQGRRSEQELWLRLQKEKNILIILDDVWAEINLKEKIGIPLCEDHKGCKVLLTTRRLQVCRSMGCQDAIPLGCLDEQEAWALFEKKASLENSDDAIKKVAGQIVQKCKGLPIAIVTMGSALKGNTNSDTWEATYRRLKNRRLAVIEDIDQENAYVCLEWSFDYLKDMGTKKCFLLCSLFPEDHEIYVEDLVRYAWGLELYQGVDSIEEVRSEVLAAIDILKNSCLLIDSGERHVQMHDVVRDVALWISSGRKEFSFSIKSEVVETWPEDETFEPYTAICFKSSRINELPKGLICANLKILLLLGDAREVCSLHDRLIAPEAFQFQTNLRTLHLERCKLLDISILGKLTNLGTLHLERCVFLDISILGKLKKLQVLSFSWSHFKELPEEIGDLNNLKLLDLSNCLSLQRIPPHLLRRLSNLEELYLHGCTSIEWAKESYAILSEVNSLPNLTVLSLEIAPIHLPKDFVFRRLQRYGICIDKYSARNHKIFKNCPIMRSLKIKASVIDACKQLFGDVEFLHLKDLVGCQNLVPSLELELGQRGFNKLTSLVLKSCKYMKCLIDTTKHHVLNTAFSNLVELSLIYLFELEELCSGDQPQGFFQKLKTLRIIDCIEMIGAIPILQNLETLEVRLCNKIQVLFQTAELGSAQQALSHHVSLKSLKVVRIDCCYKLTYLFPATVANSLVNLETLEISRCLGLQEIIQETELSNTCLQSLREVDVSECHNLTSLSSLSNGHILENLKKLRIENCSRLEYIFPTSMAEGLPQLNEIWLMQLPQLNGRDGNDIVLTLPSLQVLRVISCPQLTPFIISAKIQELSFQSLTETKQLGNMKMVPELRGRSPNMEYLTITNFEEYLFDSGYNLSSLKILSLYGLPELRVVWKGPIEDVNFQNLTALHVNGCERLRYIFSPTTSSQDHQPICFPNLTFIEIDSCANLKSLFPVSVVHCLPKLKDLYVLGLSNLEKVFEIGDEANVSKDKEKVIQLPLLNKLRLEQLPNLKSFSPMAYHFVLPSLHSLTVLSCPNITTSFSVDSKQCVHAITETIRPFDENIVEESATTREIAWPIGTNVYYNN